jgi:hypothetical protein
VLVLTTRSRPFPYHGFPFDFWRFEIGDMKLIFSDMSVEALEPDRLMPGVFVKARMPRDFHERSLEEIELYSIVNNRHCKRISELDLLPINA